MEPVETRSDIRSKFYPASPAQLFAAIQDPSRIAKWWGPEGFTNTIHTYDFVPGGSWLLTMHGPDGTDYPTESRFLRIVQGNSPTSTVLVPASAGRHHRLMECVPA